MTPVPTMGLSLKQNCVHPIALNPLISAMQSRKGGDPHSVLHRATVFLPTRRSRVEESEGIIAAARVSFVTTGNRYDEKMTNFHIEGRALRCLAFSCYRFVGLGTLL